MFRYSPPKANVWGHSLRKMHPAHQRARLDEFFRTAVAEHSFNGCVLNFFVGKAPAFFSAKDQTLWGHVTKDDVCYFEQLFGVAAQENIFYNLTEQQCETVIAELAQRENLLKGCRLMQNFDISAWLINGRQVPTQSDIAMYYGTEPRISTLFAFEKIEQFEFVSQVMLNLGLGRLNSKYLKQSSRRNKEAK